MSHLGEYGRNQDPTRRMSAGAPWKAIGNLQGKLDVDPEEEIKKTPNPIQELRP